MQDSEQEETSGGGNGTQSADSVTEGCSAAFGQGEDKMDVTIYYDIIDMFLSRTNYLACMG